MEMANICNSVIKSVQMSRNGMRLTKPIDS